MFVGALSWHLCRQYRIVSTLMWQLWNIICYVHTVCTLFKMIFKKQVKILLNFENAELQVIKTIRSTVVHCPKSNQNFPDKTWNVEENEILHEIFRVVSRIPSNISLGQCMNYVLCTVCRYMSVCGQWVCEMWWIYGWDPNAHPWGAHAYSTYTLHAPGSIDFITRNYWRHFQMH